MTRSALTGLTCTLLWFGCGILDERSRAQQIGRAPVEVQVPQPPTAAVALGRMHLVYELHLTNFGLSATTLEQVEVLDGTPTVLASWSGQPLWHRTRIVGQAEALTTGAAQPGQRAIAYLWLTLKPGSTTPSVLVHRVTFSYGSAERETVSTTAQPLSSGASPIAAPVRGGPWVAVRGPSNGSGHRLSLVTLGGRARVPQRFAVDWALLGDDGLLFRGDRTDVTNWYGYDAPVYAAAGGTVVLVRECSPDRPAFAAAPPPVIDAADAPGNVVVIDIGQGRFVTYAHLKPGSIRVARGASARIQGGIDAGVRESRIGLAHLTTCRFTKHFDEGGFSKTGAFGPARSRPRKCLLHVYLPSAVRWLSGRKRRLPRLPGITERA